MNALIDRVCRLLEIAIALALAVMVVLVFSNVVLRYGFNSGITVSEEVSRWLFIWSTFLGAIVAMREHGHLGVDMVVGKLPAWGKKVCLIVSQLLMIGMLYMLFMGSLDQTKINWDVSAPTTGLSMAIVTSVGLVFAVLGVLILLLDLWKVLSGQLRGDQLVMIQESEENVQLQQILSEHGELSEPSASKGAAQ